MGSRGSGRAESWKVAMIVCWVIWKARCKLVYEGKQPFIERLAQEIVRLAKEMLSHGISMRNRALIIAWSRPPDGVIKTNCDAAWCRVTRRGGIGTMARDSLGVVQGSNTGTRPVDSTEEAEADAILLAVRLAIHHRWPRVIIE